MDRLRFCSGGQIICVSHEAKQMLSGKNLWKSGARATALIFRFAGLDLTFMRLGVSFRRELRMLKSTRTTWADSDDEVEQ